MTLLHSILGALLPIVVTVLLGFVAAWRHDFATKDASILNRMVLLYAVPLALFAGTVSTPRTALTQDIPLFIGVGVAIIGLYSVVFLLSRFAFRASVSTSALAALIASAPAVPFVGPAILGDLFGQRSAIPIAIASLIINLTVVPITILFLTLDTREEDSQGKDPSSDGEHGVLIPTSRASVIATKLAETVKEPMVWAPLLAFVIVLSGVRISPLIVRSLSLLGHTSGGLALFASGIILASGRIKADWCSLCLVLLKNIVQPALLLGGLRWLGYGNQIVGEAVLTMAIPAMPIAIMLSVQYRVAEGVAASSVFLSVIGSVVTVGLFMALTS